MRNAIWGRERGRCVEVHKVMCKYRLQRKLEDARFGDFSVHIYIHAVAETGLTSDIYTGLLKFHVPIFSSARARCLPSVALGSVRT